MLSIYFFSPLNIGDVLRIYSDLCTEQVISLRSLAAQIAQICISAVGYTNVNGIVHKGILCIYKIQTIRTPQRNSSTFYVLPYCYGKYLEIDWGGEGIKTLNKGTLGSLGLNDLSPLILLIISRMKDEKTASIIVKKAPLRTLLAQQTKTARAQKLEKTPRPFLAPRPKYPGASIRINEKVEKRDGML